MKRLKLILSILLILTGVIAKGQIQDYVIEASDSLITRGVLQINADKFKATTQVSSDDTTLVSLDYLTNLLDAAEYADSLAFHSSTGYLVYYRAGVALDSTSMDGRYQTTLTNPVTGTGTTNYLPKWTGLTTLGNSRIIDNNGSTSINTTPDGLSELLINSDQGNVNNAALKLWYNGSNSVLGEVSMLAYRNSVWNGLYINGNGTSLTNSMYVDGTKPLIFNAGNVAIKQTSASYPLDVNGEIRSQSLIMSGTYQTAGNSIGSDNGDIYIESGGTGKKVIIRPEGHAATSGQVIIEQAGVDIPRRLTVGGIKLDNYIAEPQTIGYVSGGIYLQSAPNGVIYLRPSGTTNTGMVTITPSGTSIGGTSPTQVLDINGNARFRSIGTTTTSTVLGVTSDGTLTTNVSITGGATWKGGWNASTNTPTLSDATGTNGWWYKVTVAGTQNLGSGSQTYAVGDDVIHNGTIWQKFSAMITEADPVFVASDSYHWTTQDSINWREAYGWGDHSTEGYLTAEVDGSTTNELQNLSLGTVTTTTQPINISSGTGITLPAATTSTAGLMSADDKIKINSATSFSSSSINYIPKWTSLLGDLSATSLIYDNGTNVGIGKTSMNEKLDVNGNISVDAIVLNNYAGKNNTINSYGTDLYFEASPLGSMYFRPNGTGSNTGIVNISTGGMSVGGTAPTQTLDVNGNARFRSIGTTTTSTVLGVTSDGTLTTNVPTFLTAEVDGSVSNEGSLTVGAGTATTSIINSNTSGSTPVTVSVSTGLNIAESGNTITLTNSAPDQTVSLTGSGATSVTGTYPNFTISSTDNNTTYTGGNGLVLNGNAFDLGLQELTTGTPSLNTHFIPWVNSANNLHYRVGLLDLQNIAGYNAGKIQGVTVSSTAPTTNYVLKYNGSTWAPAADATGSSLTAGNAIVVAGDSINYKPTKVTATMTNLNVANNRASIYTNFEYNNTLYRATLGQLSDISIYNARELQGNFVSSNTPSTGEVLTWTGSQWEPEPVSTGGGMTDPMTTRGDIIYRNSSNVTARLGRGTAGQLLYSNGTDLSWRTPVKADIGLGNVENTALSTWTGSTNIGTVGSITSGNWGGDPISAVKGGTGKTSYTAYALLAGGTTSTGTLQQVSGTGTSGQVLTSNGAGALPTWQPNPVSQWTITGTLIHPTDTFVYDVAIGTKTRYSTNRLTVEGSIYASSYGQFVDGISTDGTIESTYSIIDRYMAFRQYDDILTASVTHPLLSTLNDQHRLIYRTGSSNGTIYTYSLTPHYQTTTSTGAITFDYKYGDMVNDTLTANNTYNMTYIPDGSSGEIFVRQDGTGGRTLTLNFYPLTTASTALTKVIVGATNAIKTTANKHTLIRYRRWGTKVTLEYLQEP